MTDDPGKPRRTRDTRFPKGKSGNPAGRPKKNKPMPEEGESPLSKLTSKVFEGTVFGVELRLNADELQQVKILEAAFRGQLKAIRQVLRWIEKRAQIRHQKQKNSASACVTGVFETPDPRNADDALRLLDIICERQEGDELIHEEPQVQMQAWAVEAALRRRRGANRIDSERLKWLLAYTRDGSSVKLPRGYE